MGNVSYNGGLKVEKHTLFVKATIGNYVQNHSIQTELARDPYLLHSEECQLVTICIDPSKYNLPELTD